MLLFVLSLQIMGFNKLSPLIQLWRNFTILTLVKSCWNQDGFSNSMESGYIVSSGVIALINCLCFISHLDLISYTLMLLVLYYPRVQIYYLLAVFLWFNIWLIDKILFEEKNEPFDFGRLVETRILDNQIDNLDINWKWNRYYYLRLAAKYGNFSTLQQALENVPIHLENYYVFRTVCRLGKLDLAQQLYENYDIDASAGNQYVLRHAIKNRDLEMIQWLMTLPGVVLPQEYHHLLTDPEITDIVIRRI